MGRIENDYKEEQKLLNEKPLNEKIKDFMEKWKISISDEVDQMREKT